MVIIFYSSVFKNETVFSGTFYYFHCTGLIKGFTLFLVRYPHLSTGILTIFGSLEMPLKTQSCYSRKNLYYCVFGYFFRNTTLRMTQAL